MTEAFSPFLAPDEDTRRELTIEEDGVANGCIGDLRGLKDGRGVCGRVTADGDDDLLRGRGGERGELFVGSREQCASRETWNERREDIRRARRRAWSAS